MGVYRKNTSKASRRVTRKSSIIIDKEFYKGIFKLLQKRYFKNLLKSLRKVPLKLLSNLLKMSPVFRRVLCNLF